MVRIEYTDIGGKKTQFGTNSASEAMQKLRGIRGYSGNMMDSVAAGLAPAFALRHNINAERVKGIKRNRTKFSGISSNDIFYSGEGTVAKVRNLSSLSMQGGKLVSTTRSGYVSDRGSVVSVGGKREEKVADIPSMGEVSSVAKKVATEVAHDLMDSQKKDKSSGLINVVSGISFDASDGPLKIVVETTPIKAETAGGKNTSTYKIGEEVMVHESMSVERHSFVYVISRKSNVSSVEAKVVT